MFWHTLIVRSSPLRKSKCNGGFDCEVNGGSAYDRLRGKQTWSGGICVWTSKGTETNEMQRHDIADLPGHIKRIVKGFEPFVGSLSPDCY